MITSDRQQRILLFQEQWDKKPGSRAFAPLADLLREEGRPSEALAILEQGLDEHPEFITALVIQGRCWLETDRSDLARKVFHRVLHLDPDNLVALRLLSEEARSRKDWREAMPYLESLVRLDAEESRWKPVLAEAKAMLGRPDPEEGPPTAFATMTLVEIYLAQGYRAKAMQALRQIQEREPDRQDVRERIAEIGIIEGEGFTGPDDTAPGKDVLTIPEADEIMEERRRRQLEKRAAEKRQFEEWINKIRSDENESSLEGRPDPGTR